MESLFRVLASLATTCVAGLITASIVVVLTSDQPPDIVIVRPHTPAVNVAAPEVTVAAPNVEVTLPELKAPEVKLAVPQTSPTSDGRFVVHEWGTFNHMDGAPVGLQHEDEVLPDFVYSRTEERPSPWAHVGDESLRVAARGVRSKMETPILYFYSDKKRDAKVEVGFAGGMMSEWYPQASFAMEDKAGRALTGDAIDLGQIGRSSLTWDFEVLPVDQVYKEKAPVVPDQSPWAIGRRPQSSELRTRSGEREDYLFYRGLGDHVLPLSVAHEGPNCVGVRASRSIDFGIALQIVKGKARYTRVAPMQKGERRNVRYGRFLDKAEAVRGMRELMVQGLISRGLFEDEATAMVDTWTRTWFQNDGNRVLYFLDDDTVSEILPLKVTPTPTELVRVLVGRMEYLTGRENAAVHQAVMKQDRAALARFGRFAEPILRSFIARKPFGDDANEKASALLTELTAR